MNGYDNLRVTSKNTVQTVFQTGQSPTGNPGKLIPRINSRLKFQINDDSKSSHIAVGYDFVKQEGKNGDNLLITSATRRNHQARSPQNESNSNHKDPDIRALKNALFNNILTQQLLRPTIDGKNGLSATKPLQNSNIQFSSPSLLNNTVNMSNHHSNSAKQGINTNTLKSITTETGNHKSFLSPLETAKINKADDELDENHNKSKRFEDRSYLTAAIADDNGTKTAPFTGMSHTSIFEDDSEIIKQNKTGSTSSLLKLREKLKRSERTEGNATKLQQTEKYREPLKAILLQNKTKISSDNRSISSYYSTDDESKYQTNLRRNKSLENFAKCLMEVEEKLITKNEY